MTAASVLERARHSLEGYWELLTSDKKTQYLLICSVYLLIFAYHTRRSLPVYHATFRKQGSFSLVLHILAGSFELVRYYTRAVDGNVVPEVLDTVACFVQAFTTLRLSKTLLRGDMSTRPSYQAPALMRPFIGLAAIVYQSASIHRASVKLLHAFLYTRMIIFLAKRFGVGKIHSNATIYAHAVFLGAIIAIDDSGLPAGVPVYIGMVGAVMVLNRYVANRLARSSASEVSMSIWERTLMCVLLWLGLANLEAIKEHDHSSKPTPSANDEYVQEGM
ncbi:hypothetical protein BGZ61DRAFT_485539 [Ilyonectria robusta]|uniref:uncharacterized protein n=1 Tax=Ilyonectria robusta TaxID=1079257 RepID=UPI001E8DEE67|nr:uncharacterized protein BGZ61DRAFT_485539 [Ilyonectria robusta]KAH8661193.1 hypothetical protein BGZ61DRAFT_485539 [Ilyonectria robusta]